MSLLTVFFVSAQTPCNVVYYWDTIPGSDGFQMYDYSTAFDGVVVAWDWSVTDNNGVVVAQDDAQNPTFYFNDFGEYTICLTIVTEGVDSMMQDSIMSTCVECNTYEYLGDGLVEVDDTNPSSWNCVNGGCVEAQNQWAGEYTTYDECYWACSGVDTVMSWNCVGDECEVLMDDSGIFNSYGACLDYCEDDDPIGVPSCEAGFYAMSDSLDVMPIIFVDQSVLDGGLIEEWYWEVIGTDGVQIAESGEQYPSFTFDSYGDYMVCLSIYGVVFSDSLNEVMTYTCFECDTFLYDENGFVAYSDLGQTALVEHLLVPADDHRIFDIQGREWKGNFADLPRGMYIINRKKVMKFE